MQHPRSASWLVAGLAATFSPAAAAGLALASIESGDHGPVSSPVGIGSDRRHPFQFPVAPRSGDIAVPLALLGYDDWATPPASSRDDRVERSVSGTHGRARRMSHVCGHIVSSCVSDEVLRRSGTIGSRVTRFSAIGASHTLTSGYSYRSGAARHRSANFERRVHRAEVVGGTHGVRQVTDGSTPARAHGCVWL